MKLCQINESLDFNTLSTLSKSLEKKYGLDQLSIIPNNVGDMYLNTIIVPKEKRNQGIGTKVMKEIIDFANKNKLRIVLSPATKDDYIGTTSRSRLVNFYKSLGFVENKGRNKDFRVMGGMIYRPPGYEKY